MQNRPWSVWWDFCVEDSKIHSIIVQTNHPDYQHVEYIYQFPIEECEDSNGYVDGWVDTWFKKFEDDVMSGRHSIHKLMTALGHKKNGN